MRNTLLPYLPDFPRLQPVEKSLRRMRRQVRQQYLKTLRQTRRTVKLVTANTRRWFTNQYFVIDAAYDLRQALRQSEDIVLGTLIACTLFALTLVTAVTSTFYFVFQAFMNVSDSLHLSLMPLLFVAFGFMSVSLLWGILATSNAMQLAIVQSLNRKWYCSLRHTLGTAMRDANRTLFTVLATLLLVLTPLAAAGLLYVVLVYFDFLTELQSIAVAPYLIILGIVWLMYSAMNYMLVPTVALLDKTLSFKQAVARSHELVARRGRLFLLGLTGIMLLSVLNLFGFAKVIETMLAVNTTPVLIIGGYVIFLAQQAVLAAFYRRRRLSRVR